VLLTHMLLTYTACPCLRPDAAASSTAPATPRASTGTGPARKAALRNRARGVVAQQGIVRAFRGTTPTRGLRAPPVIRPTAAAEPPLRGTPVRGAHAEAAAMVRRPPAHRRRLHRSVFGAPYVEPTHRAGSCVRKHASSHRAVGAGTASVTAPPAATPSAPADAGVSCGRGGGRDSGLVLP
jgi:hypothetical protein